MIKMSRWCHVSATILGDSKFAGSHSELVEEVQKVLEKAPKVTGSERDLDVFVNAISGYSSWTSCDCKNCKYGNTVKYLEEGGFTCECDEEWECPSGEAQNEVVITLAGDLRDRDYRQIANELDKFLKFIKKHIFVNEYDIRNCVAIINDEYIKKPIILWDDVKMI